MSWNDDSDALGRAVDGGTAGQRRKRGVSIEWAQRVEAQLGRVEALVLRLLDEAPPQPEPTTDSPGWFLPGSGWLHDELHREREQAASPEAAASAIARIRAERAASRARHPSSRSDEP